MLLIIFFGFGIVGGSGLLASVADIVPWKPAPLI